ncbi:hypothetical protein DERF_003983 [Dermatophagoides farinae]|uniref:Uncharacterized protein n=1 Tax=Dermatophagoides farinae TaxID=6954 RepID=A0A922IH46_DERFA|nr:hypothetical protein DERF_003983 [Dermatophagoides farinae]
MNRDDTDLFHFGLSNFDNDAQTNEAIGYPMAAMCVRMSSDQSVLHFTPINVASYVLPRPASRNHNSIVSMILAQCCFEMKKKMPCICGSSNRIMLESARRIANKVVHRYNKSQVSTSELSMTPPIATQVSRSVCDNGQHIVRIENQVFHCSNKNTDNDPSAGSPTETLLRLLLPLDVQVWSSFRPNMATTRMATLACPKTSLKHPIGSSDGRCVQRAGT